MIAERPATGAEVEGSDFDQWPDALQRWTRSEALAVALYPWENLVLESAGLDAILGFRREVQARLPRAIFWALAICYGDKLGEAAPLLLPGLVTRRITKTEALAILTVTPYRPDPETLGGVAALLSMTRRVLIPADMPADAAEMRAEFIEAAQAAVQTWAGWIESAERGEDGLRLVELGDGWRRVESPSCVAACRRVLRENRRRSAGAF